MNRSHVLPVSLAAALVVATIALIIIVSSGSQVADIGGKVSVQQDSFNRWMATTAKTSFQANIAPDPPEYTKCIKAQASKKSAAKTSNAALKQLCQAQQLALNQQVLQQLVTQGWVLAEAEVNDIKANQKAVDQQAKQLRAQYPETTDGVNDQDLKTQAESIILQQQLRAQASKQQAKKPSESDLRDFYNKNRQLFARPATRDVYLLLSDSKAGAQQAASALRSGQNWNNVFKKYNSPRLWNSKTALLSQVSSKSWLPELRKAIFSAPIGPITGPTSIKLLKAYVVVQVKSSQPGQAAPSFSKSLAQVEQAYLAEQAAKAGQSSVKQLQKNWQSKTKCQPAYAKWYPCKGTPAPSSAS